MANFHYAIKRQSYEIAVQRTGEALRAGDVVEGKYYLSKAIELSAQLVEHCVIANMRDIYVAEHRKLTTLLSQLERGENPFLAPVVASSATVAPSVSFAASNDFTSPPVIPQNAATATGYEFFSSQPPAIKLADVAGLDDVKKQIRLRVIAPMRHPDLFGRYLDAAGCQILMYGPPGCGKSFVAEAIAGELGCAYAIINASDLLDKYVGEGSKKVIRIFKEASNFENCMIFFDELEAIFASRESEDSRYSKDVLTTFLSCLSGFGTQATQGTKVIIGATNRPWALDSALLRGKRFDTHIYVGLPDAQARQFLIQKAFQGKQALLEGSDLTIDGLTEVFDGYSCADIDAILDKVKVMALERALDRHAQGEDDNVPVTMSDVIAVLRNHRNSVTEESLLAFEAFQNGES